MPRARALAKEAGFPEHALVLRPDSKDDPRIRKGLADWPSLRRAFDEALAESRTSAVFVESDLRAHMNPTRMEVIRRATEDLVARMRSECPRCGLGGFWAVERIPDLPCAECKAPTDETRAERWGCVSGDHYEIRERSGVPSADPYRCGACNP